MISNCTYSHWFFLFAEVSSEKEVSALLNAIIIMISQLNDSYAHYLLRSKSSIFVLPSDTIVPDK